jgi:hypothetical protein
LLRASAKTDALCLKWREPPHITQTTPPEAGNGASEHFFAFWWTRRLRPPTLTSCTALGISFTPFQVSQSALGNRIYLGPSTPFPLRDRGRGEGEDSGGPPLPQGEEPPAAQGPQGQGQEEKEAQEGGEEGGAGIKTPQASSKEDAEEAS